jgi:energy-converting hydrogenase A subunit M
LTINRIRIFLEDTVHYLTMLLQVTVEKVGDLCVMKKETRQFGN